MDRIISSGKTYTQYKYPLEAEFEAKIVEFSADIFGPRSAYFDIKKRIGKDNILTIPDGYLIDFTFKEDPRLYIIENELASHDPYKHIGQQLLKFAISYKASGRKIKSFLMEQVLADPKLEKLVHSGAADSGYRNVDDFLDNLIFDKPVAAVIVIDEITSDLQNVVQQLTMDIDIIEFQTFVNGKDEIHKYTPFQEEIRPITDSKKPAMAVEDIDTVVVPANEDGFKETFLGEDCWYQIRMSSAMRERVKYIAAYQTAPVSAITHIAEIDRIEKYRDTGKYIVYFKAKAKKIGPIKLPAKKPNLAPQSLRYTALSKLKGAKSIEEAF